MPNFRRSWNLRVWKSSLILRLAFAVAAHVRADLLLVDEVLSVGDMAFQQKCLAKMNELRDNGTTIVFISHNMWSVSTFCQRALLLQAGQITAEGNPRDVIQIYRRQERERLRLRFGEEGRLDEMAHASQSGGSESENNAFITSVELLNAAGQPEQSFDSYDRLIVRAHYVARTRIATPLYVIRIYRADGLICCELGGKDERAAAQRGIHGSGTLEARIGPLQLVPDVYFVEVHIVDSEQPLAYARSSQETFHIKGSIAGSDRAGVFRPNVTWFSQPVNE
jgi:lipopolysaccharide transport system ATP-binding protein